MTGKQQPTSKQIEDYALLADGQTAALVARDATIEWLCLPRFDSEACFAALLGNRENGCWALAPEAEVTRTSRRYLGDTLILETVFETAAGEVAVTDFMPPRKQAPDIVRIVEGRRGRVAMRSHLAPRFDYGRLHPLVRRHDGREAIAIAGPNAVVLRFDVDIEEKDHAFVSRFTVAEGERVAMTMTWYPSHGEVPDRVDPPIALTQTRDFWEGWAAGINYEGPARAQVVRSLMTLKALIHEPTGGIVAAPTTGLPELPGGHRNWDYRYCWLRDATFTLLAFHQAGLDREAVAWIEWLRRAIAGAPIDVQPVFTVDGRRQIPEWEAKWLGGFGGATPVRIGNAAAEQCQLDVYGEVMDTLLIACEREIDGDNDALVRLLAERLEELWQQPDAGFWESRGEPRHHVQSKVMCWVAFDRAARWFERDRERREHYRRLAEQVRAEVLEKGFDEDRNAFTRAYDDRALDASVLLLPLVGFIAADDPKMAGTVAAIERTLIRNGLVLRYLPQGTDDGVGGEEGAFIACSFWLADVYALQGRRDEADALFERACGLANDLGLLSEEACPETGRLLGNMPQALSHLSLVGTAMNLSRHRGPAQARTETAAG